MGEVHHIDDYTPAPVREASWFLRLARAIHVRGITYSSQIAVSGFIVMLALIEFVGIYEPEASQPDYLRIIHLPINYDLFQDILNYMWLLHLPITMFRSRPQWLTNVIIPTLVFAWFVMASVISMAGWFDFTMKAALWVFMGLMSMVWFRVILGDKVE
jgi:hypothetical protein